jgi:hypothetical protein
MENKEMYDFFWGGPFSNWYPSKFSVDGVTFNCGEQYMMYMKAITFEDHEIAKQIMKTDDPAKQKALGRLVKNYDDNYWSVIRFDLVKKGLIEKFKQNPELKKYLLDRKDKIIVEASPYDRIWGIGYDQYDPNILEQKDNWGQNLLGKVLMLVARELSDNQ